MRNIKLIALGLLIVATFGQPQTEADLRVCGTPRDTTIVPSASADLQSLVSSNKPLTFDLLNQYADSKNLIISSYRIRRDLVALSAGAMGATLNELQMVTDTASINSGDLLAAFDAYDVAHDANIQSLNGSYVYQVISGPLVPSNFTILPAFLNEIGLNLGYCIYDVNYTDDLSNEAFIINAFANQNGGTANNLVTSDQLSSDQNLLWLYAGTLDFSWLNPFYSSDTVAGANFTLVNGTVVQADSLFNPDEQLMYIYENNYTFIHKMIANGNYGVSFIIPDSGLFDSVKSNLSWAWYFDVRSRAQMQDVAFSLPKLHIEALSSIKASLTGLGLATTFVDGQADFQGIDSVDDVYLTDYIKDVKFGFDEAGSQPNAAGVMAPANRVIAPTVIPVSANIPFIAVVSSDTTIDFIIQIVDPTAM